MDTAQSCHDVLTSDIRLSQTILNLSNIQLQVRPGPKDGTCFKAVGREDGIGQRKQTGSSQTSYNLIPFPLLLLRGSACVCLRITGLFLY